MKKIIYKTILSLSFLLCTIMYSCIEYTIYCGKLNDKIMFVPQNVEIKDSITFYTNKGDSSLHFFVSRKDVTDDSFSSNCDCICSDYFEIELRNSIYSKYGINNISYQLEHGSYRNENDAMKSPVQVSVSIDARKYAFNYTVKDGALNSKFIDSLMINGTYYYDVVSLNNTDVILGDAEQTIYIARDYGLVQILETDGTAWTLQKAFE